MAERRSYWLPGPAITVGEILRALKTYYVCLREQRRVRAMHEE